MGKKNNSLHFKMSFIKPLTYNIQTQFNLDSFILNHYTIGGNYHAKSTTMIVNKLHDMMYLACSLNESEMIVLIAVSMVMSIDG